MSAVRLSLLALCILSLPLAFAHSPAGTPKNYCEPVEEWGVHEYVAGGGGRVLQGFEDGNLGGDCDGLTSADPGKPCAGYRDPADPLTLYVALCDADVSPPLADYDGHAELATGGAWLLVRTGTGEASKDPAEGAGTFYCFGELGHHSEFPTVTVHDVLLGAGAGFTVAADLVDLTGTGDGCGDFQSDQGTRCTGTCAPTFAAGLDGSYQVYVDGTAGHVESALTMDPQVAGRLIVRTYFSSDSPCRYGLVCIKYIF